MPALSIRQRRLMAIAEHHPDKLRPENRGVLRMNHTQLHDYAATPERGLPRKKANRYGGKPLDY